MFWFLLLLLLFGLQLASGGGWVGVRGEGGGGLIALH